MLRWKGNEAPHSLLAAWLALGGVLDTARASQMREIMRTPSAVSKKYLYSRFAVGQAIVFHGLPSSSTVRRRQTTIVCATPGTGTVQLMAICLP